MPTLPAAAEPPRGKILVIEDHPVVALDLQRMLREAGYRTVGPAADLHDIDRLSRLRAMDVAILDVDVDRRLPLPAADLLAFAEIPFVFLADRGARTLLPQRHADRPVVAKPIEREPLLVALERALARRSPANTNLPPPGERRDGWPRVVP